MNYVRGEKMSKKNQKAPKNKGFVQTSEKANGTKEYYITKAPQKTLVGKIIILTLVGLMALGSVASIIIALISLS